MNESDYVAPTYPYRELQFNRGEGVYLFDSQGKKYLDFIGNYGATVLGHASPHLAKGLIPQLSQLTALHGSFYNEQRARCAKKLVEISPKSLTKVFFSSTGTETVEAALKFARLATGKTEILSANRGYHGKTFGSLSATATNPKYNKPYLPLVPDFNRFRYNDIDNLRETVSEKTAAVILEPIQGEGGVRPATREFLVAAQRLCLEYGALLIFDEVQTGVGRTGNWFMCQEYGIDPDIMCVSKALGNGFPIGATLVSEAVSEKLFLGCHTSTFGGNPLACTAALTVLETIEQEGLLHHVQEMGTYLREQLTSLDLPLVREIRGHGVMVGMELKTRVARYLKPFQDEGLLMNTAGSTVLRMLPPYIIQKEHIDKAVKIIKKVIQ